MQINSAKQIVIILMLFGIILGCHPSNKNTLESSAVERTDSCLSNPVHSYELFIPGDKKTAKNLPLLVAIDPHGNGKIAIDHLKDAASKYQAVLVASNLIQNNDRNYIQELDELIADVKSRSPVSDHIYLVGFSGGARMVLEYATHRAVDGVIASGAFAGPAQISAIKCPVMGLIGMDDFNFLETVQYILNPEKMPSNAHVELSKSTHEWPNKTRLTTIFGWFQLKNESVKKYRKKQVEQYVEKQKERIDSLNKAEEFIEAVCIGCNMASVNSFENMVSFRSVVQKITNTTAYRQQLSALAESLRFEVKMRQIYGQALLDKDKDWWEKEISMLHEKMNLEPDEMKKMAFKRLSGFIEIVCYSYTRRFATQKDIPHLAQILMVYRLAEPDNPEMQRFSEILEKLKTQH